MKRGKKLFGKATFVMDRGYDDNKMFLKLDELGQNYVIRLTAKRRLFFQGKWVPATQLRNQRKGKIKTPFIYKGENRSKEDEADDAKTYFSRWRIEEYFRCKSRYSSLKTSVCGDWLPSMH